MKTDEEIGAEAAKLAHDKIMQEAASVKLTTKKVLLRIAQGLDAHEIKVFYDRTIDQCVYSDKLINWTARAKSIDQAMAVLGMQANEMSINHKIDDGSTQSAVAAIAAAIQSGSAGLRVGDDEDE